MDTKLLLLKCLMGKHRGSNLLRSHVALILSKIDGFIITQVCFLLECNEELVKCLYKLYLYLIKNMLLN